MSLTINTAIEKGAEYESHIIKSGKSVFAGDLEVGSKNTDSIIAQKRGFAQKQAMKLIGNAWDNDTRTAQGISDMEKMKSDKLSELQELNSKMKDIENSKPGIQEEYGIDPNSQEQKDLELLEKYHNYKSGTFGNDFSKEEIDRLGELQNLPRTEYQNKILALNAVTNELNSNAYRKEQEIFGINQSITDAKIDQLKSQDMQKATEAADEIMDATNKEILGVLLQDGVDNIDEDMQENQEKAEESKDKQEEQQEKIDKAKQNRDEQEEILNGEAQADKLDRNVTMQQQTETSVEQVQKHIQKILEENNLIKEDLKGIKIDFNF